MRDKLYIKAVEIENTYNFVLNKVSALQTYV
jgi:hypothetical protein